MNKESLVFIALCIVQPRLLAQIERTPWPDPTANEVVPYPSTGLTHGPMLGRPTDTSMRVWIRTETEAKFKVMYNTSLPLTVDMPGVVGHTKTEDDYTGIVDLKNLTPNTAYYYGIVIDGRLADTRMNYEPGFPLFRTLPDVNSYREENYNPKGIYNFSFGTSFGNRQGRDRYNNNPAYENIMKNHPNLSFFIMNGDYIYEDTRTSANRPHTISMFRKDYRNYLERGKGMSRFFRHVPAFFMYDDHESFSDLEGTGEIGLKDGKWLYRDVSLRPWYEYNGWANYQGPHNQSIQWGMAEVKAGTNTLYDPKAKFKSLRLEAISNIHVHMRQKNAGVYAVREIIDDSHIRVHPSFINDETCRYTVGSHHYFDWKVSNCHFFCCDTRGERTRYVPEKVKDPDRFLLGEAQRRWLLDGVKHTDADFIFIISTVSWMMYHTNFHVTDNPKIVAGRSIKEDGFTGAVVERDILIRAFDKLEKPVIILTGDLHNAFVIQISDNVWEMMMGPIGSANHPVATAGNPPYGGWFDSEGTHVKIKWASGFPNEVSYKRLRHNYYGIININNVMKSGRQKESGHFWVVYDEPQIVAQIYDAYTGKLIYAEGISTADAKPKRGVKKPSVR